MKLVFFLSPLWRSKPGVVGYLRYESIGLGGIVHAAAVMREPVAHDEVVCLQHHVVSTYLVENILGDIHRGGLVFDDDAWAQCTVIHHRVAPSAHSVEPELHLVGHE